MKSFYLSPSDAVTKSLRPLKRLFLLSLALLMTAGLSVIATFGEETKPTSASAIDPIQWLACYFGPDSKPDFIYQATQTSNIQFQFFSKSYIGSDAQDVRTGLNGLLNYVMTQGEDDSPYSFEAVNERIIGQNFTGTLPMNDEAYLRWNRGPKINPYNRFGVAGLSFSNYAGEWKHLFIDACEDDDQPEAQYDTGASTNVVRVAAWNVCARVETCNLPDFPNPQTGQAFTPNEIWDPFEERMARGKAREMSAISPDVLLLQESGPDDTVRETVYGVLCSGMGPGYDGNTSQTLCYNEEKFRAVKNEEFRGAQGSKNFSSTSAGGRGGYTWMILEDKSLRRSVFVSLHLESGADSDDTRYRQAKFVAEDMTQRFSGSLYPIVLGGDWNSYDPTNCERINELPANKDGGARAMCEAGFISANSLATSRTDLEKKSFQGFSPWSSIEGPHLDHIWVNSFVGVGEARVFAPAGRASSDHTMVSATVNLNGLSVAQPGDPQDPQTGKFYTTRLEPRSTWEDIATSDDVRTRQFSSGFGSRYGAAMVNNLTNWLFFLTKLVVVFAIAFIGFAFSDIGKLTKLTEIVGGDGGGDPGVFGRLYDGVFLPLVVLAFICTAVYLFWTAIVKRQIRAGLGGLLRSVLCFLAAVIIAISPAWFIALPNNVALVGQALVVSQLDEGLAGGNGLCDSNLDAADTLLDDTGNLTPGDPDSSAGFLERVSVNMQSGTGCMLWYNLLFRPWVEGQFGSEYTELYGTLNGDCITKGSAGPGYSGLADRHVCLGDEKPEKHNRNYEWVGDPVVPLGGGTCYGVTPNRCDAKLESNWALLQVSAQTNAHAPILPPEDRGRTSRYSQGVAVDWWRIVDAMSNYHEKRVPLTVCEDDCTGGNGGVETPPFPQIEETSVMEEWDDWTGSNQGSRLWTVTASFLIALFGVMAPLVFAALSTIYAIGLTILMAFAPIFFLFGCWAGRGWNIFMAWADMVINTAMKRIALGLLTVLSIAITAGLLNQMEQLGMFQTLLLIVLISFALVKSRQKIFSAVSFARFSTADLSGTASRVNSKLQAVNRAGKGFVVAGAAGGIASARRGEGFKGGALAGFKSQADALTYQNSFLRSIKTGHEMESMDHSKYLNDECPICEHPLEEGQAYGRANGPRIFGIVHAECVEKGPEEAMFEELGVIVAKNKIASAYSYRKSAISEIEDPTVEGLDKLDHLTYLIEGVLDEVAQVKRERKDRPVGSKKEIPPPALPKELEPYVDRQALRLAWEEGEYEYIKLAYGAGWIAWAEGNGYIDEELDQRKKMELLQLVQSDRN